MKTTLVFTLFFLLLLPAVAFCQGQPMAPEQVYQKVCSVCHNTGVAGAPKLGDKEAWAPRIAEGIDKLYASALNGDGAMPAKGGNSDLSDTEVRETVDYMVDKSK